MCVYRATPLTGPLHSQGHSTQGGTPLTGSLHSQVHSTHMVTPLTGPLHSRGHSTHRATPLTTSTGISATCEACTTSQMRTELYTSAEASRVPSAEKLRLITVHEWPSKIISCGVEGEGGKPFSNYTASAVGARLTETCSSALYPLGGFVPVPGCVGPKSQCCRP